MKSLLSGILIGAIFFFTGLAGSFSIANDAYAAEPDLFLGNSASQTTIYVVSDWFCPICRKVEPEIDRLIPELAKTVRLRFVDFPVHKETLNFTPYNLQFVAFEKSKYPALRKTLAELALKTKKPTDSDVSGAIAPLGVKLRDINYADTLSGMQSNMAVYRGYKLKSTPSVVVTNSKTGKTKILVGDRQISETGLRSAITEVEK